MLTPPKKINTLQFVCSSLENVIYIRSICQVLFTLCLKKCKGELHFLGQIEVLIIIIAKPRQAAGSLESYLEANRRPLWRAGIL